MRIYSRATGIYKAVCYESSDYSLDPTQLKKIVVWPGKWIYIYCDDLTDDIIEMVKRAMNNYPDHRQ